MMNEALREALELARPYVEASGQRAYDGTNGHGMRTEANRRLALIDAALSAPSPAYALTDERLLDLWRLAMDSSNSGGFLREARAALASAAPADQRLQDYADGYAHGVRVAQPADMLLVPRELVVNAESMIAEEWGEETDTGMALRAILYAAPPSAKPESR